jgi:hypothetical protein
MKEAVMAKKKIVKKIEDVDRIFNKADELDTGLWLEALDKYYEENQPVSEDVWSSKDDAEAQSSGWYGVENLFGGEIEAILIFGKPEKAKSLTKLVKSQKGMAAFTLAYAGQGVFRYALPSEEESVMDSFKLVPNDPSQVGSKASSMRQW